MEHLGNILAGSLAIFIFELETKCLDESSKIEDFLPIWSIVNAVDESGAGIFAISHVHISSNFAISKKHEVFNKLVGIFAFLFIDSNRFA